MDLRNLGVYLGRWLAVTYIYIYVCVCVCVWWRSCVLVCPFSVDILFGLDYLTDSELEAAFRAHDVNGMGTIDRRRVPSVKKQSPCPASIERVFFF